MREIKFRAFDKIAGEIYDVGYIDFANEVVQVAMIKGGICYGTYVRRLKDVALLQYTGLKDKNGKEIYEEDIVKHPIFGVNPVQYSDHMELCNGRWILSRCYKDVEVIGNIYENPELLEESK